MDLAARLARHRRRIDRRLAQLLPPAGAFPSSLHRAMRYSVLGGGKRLRPILCLEAAALAGRAPAGLLDLACALECIHTYSLIHDDLPALDNDDCRRGRPTCHKKFGEATAILAGDALLTLAFDILARLHHRAAARILADIAAAAGTRGGMIGGQMADLEAEGKRVSARQLASIHRSKTGALIRAAVRSGALYAGARPSALARLTRFGERLGLAFQIVDDILDVRSSRERLGKTVGQDAARRKATYPALFGLARSERMASRLIDDASRALAPLGRRAAPLQALARNVLARAARQSAPRQRNA